MTPDISQTENRILAALGPEEYQLLAPHLERISLQSEEILYEQGDPISQVFFPERAIVSLVYLLEDGATTEIGVVGNEGLVGLPAILVGKVQSLSRAMVQSGGPALRAPAEPLKQIFERGGHFHQLLLRYSQARLDQLSLLAIYKTHYSIREQFAYWLLSISDRAHSDELHLTQKFIAEMLGIRRASVTDAARPLQEAGIIRYSRGRIVILDREALEVTAGECYQVMKRAFTHFLEIV